jgi:hypothetical protein
VKPKELEYLAEVLSMLLQVLAIDKNVIEEDEDKLPEVLGEDVIHQMLECRWSVTQPEGHHQVFVVDTSQTYLQFLMLHACSYTICFVFCYTSWCFYAFSRNNLLTRCHSVSFLFSAIFVF